MKPLLISLNIVIFILILILGFENINNLGVFYFLTNTNVGQSSMMGPLFIMAFIGFIQGVLFSLLFFYKSKKDSKFDNKEIFNSVNFNKRNENDW